MPFASLNVALNISPPNTPLPRFSLTVKSVKVGKVNAARVTQILIDNFKVEGIINVGSAGSCNDELEIGDIVIGKKLVQHDFDITAFGHEKGFISNVGQYVESDEQLIVKIEKIIK